VCTNVHYFLNSPHTCKDTLKYVYNFVIERDTEDVAGKDENCLSTLISDAGEVYKGCW